MTITYTASVATSHFGTFIKLLARWRGSIYKLMWRELVIFILAYYALSLVYRFALPPDHKRTFEKVALYCEGYNNLIPVAFVLGFYVTIILTRWWDQFNIIPWPDRFAVFVTANVHGHDDRGRLMRRSIMRYCCLSFVFTFRSICTVVKKRFPTLDHVTEAGFMNKDEQKIIEGIETPHNKYFVPLVWATSLISRARKEGRIQDDFAVKTLLDEVNQFRGQLGSLFNYDWISVPLVYTQTVTLSVYTFFLSCLMGRQFLEPDQGFKHRVDIYFPVFTVLQFIFYMGWLKVAESLINPFGEDDEDFDINSLIDRNLQVSYLIVDGMHLEHPQLIKDQYWDDVDFELPYTAASEQFKTEPHKGSAVDISVKEKDSEFMPLPSLPENQTLFSTFVEEGKNIMEDRSTPKNIPLPMQSDGSLQSRISPRAYSKKSSVQEKHFPQRQVSNMSASTTCTRSDLHNSQQMQEDTQDIFAMSDLDDQDGYSTSPKMERVEMIDLATLPKPQGAGTAVKLEDVNLNTVHNKSTESSHTLKGSSPSSDLSQSNKPNNIWQQQGQSTLRSPGLNTGTGTCIVNTPTEKTVLIDETGHPS